MYVCMQQTVGTGYLEFGHVVFFYDAFLMFGYLLIKFFLYSIFFLLLYC